MDIITQEIKGYMDSGLNAIEAFVEYSERHSIEISVLADIAEQSPYLLSELTKDAEALNLIEKTSRLPV